MPVAKSSKKSRRMIRIARVPIAPGISLTTYPGSLYSALCKVLARLGHLEQQDELFRNFQARLDHFAAHRLLQQIGVARPELEAGVRADEEYLAHCNKRTRMYRQHAAKRLPKYSRILRDPAICDAKGRWIGDINEALNILSGARTLKQVRRGKNLRILNRAGLMFDRMSIGNDEFAFLYKQKWHRVFKRAITLAFADGNPWGDSHEAPSKESGQ